MIEDNTAIDALARYYAASSTQAADEQLLAAIYRKREGKKARIYGAASGFTCAALIAIALLAWAAMPAHTQRDDMSSAIARYQMIHMGLVENTQSNRMESTR